ncbi:hypothetical protein BJX99DRAFT_234392 [Aspergillus californicus]
MPPVQMDALGAFAFLSESLPEWITRLADLTAHTTAKHAEFAEAFKAHSANPLRPRKRRNSSVCSIQTSSLRSGNPGGRRRRGTNEVDNSSLYSGEGSSVISTRHNLIIHYDGYTQKALEELVRNIGTARNNLRKGKISQLPLPGGSRSAARSSARGLLPVLDSVDPNDMLASIRSARTRGPPVQSPTPDPAPVQRQSPFDLVDKHLELAHSFCETAAYHFLRAGSCESELGSVRDKFTVLLRISTEEVQLLQQEKKDEPVEEETETPTEAAEPPLPSLKRPSSSEGAIEVDDEQVEVEPIDLSAFRVGRLRR